MRPEYAYEVEQLKNIVAQAKSVVFFGGAGVSTDSGIPDFRGQGGLYEEGESKEYFLSRECLYNEPEKFYNFFRKHMLYPGAEPNEAHLALAELEKRGVLTAVITQNIDGLHQAAGSQKVMELHGTCSRYYCTHCRKMYGKEIVQGSGNVPFCSVCGSMIRPDVVLYGEGLPGFPYAEAADAIAEADVLIVGGSSLVVHPAASLIDLFRGKHLVIINYSPTPYDGLAELIIRDSVGEVLRAVADHLP